MTANIRRGTRIIWIGVVVLIVLRQDLWFWNDPSLVFDILPIGLAWQIVISIAAAILWLMATKIAWPSDDSYLEVSSSGQTTPTTGSTNTRDGQPKRSHPDQSTEASR